MSIQEPLVCICIPNYNNERTIAETLDSLLNQTYKNILIKVFDNASTDNSIALLRDYQIKYNNIHIFQNESNIGGEANFTKCIENMEGEFAAIYHADDLYAPEMIEAQVKILSTTDVAAVFTCANLIDENSKIIGKAFLPNELKGKEFHEFTFEMLFRLILKHDNFLITPSVMARTQLYQNYISQWDESKFKTSADLDVWLRFTESGKIGLLTRRLMSYRISSASFSFRSRYKRLTARDMFSVIDYYLQKYKDVNFDSTDYEYLKLKDNIQITCNRIINGHPAEINLLKNLNVSLVKKIFLDIKKFKIFCFGALIQTLSNLKLDDIALFFIKKVYKI